MRPYNRCKGGIHAKKRKSIFFVERRKRRGERVCERAVEEMIHPAI